MPNKKDPLTVEEMKNASEIFFPLFDIVKTRMPSTSTIEDVLKVMENIAKLAHKQRSELIEKEQSDAFGFIKTIDKNENS
tara:strand:+ start:7209 stop:7448 length:240 start_codon:yes stop_codon:yes gene_type:complete